MGGPYLFERVRSTTTTTGTGTLTLAGALDSSYKAFGDVLANGDKCHYEIRVAGVLFEIGLGTYTVSGTTLSRDTVLSSSNSGALVSLPAGVKDVWLTEVAGSFDRTFRPQMFGAKCNSRWKGGGSFTASSSTLTGGGNPFALTDVGKTIWLQGGGTTRTVTDAAITSGSGALTSATGAFTAADLGRHCQVNGAGAAGATLTSQIVAIISGTSVQLNDHAGTTVSGATAKISANLLTTIATFVDSNNVTLTSGAVSDTLSGVHFVFGNDDTAAIQAAIAAAIAVGGTVLLQGQSIITAELDITANMTLKGDGAGTYVFEKNTGVTTGSILYWCGANQSTMLKVAPIITTTPVIGVVIDSIMLHGNKGVAGTGLRMEACAQCIVRNLFVKQIESRCMDLNVTTLSGFTGIVNFVDASSFENIWLHPCASAVGLYLDGIAASTSDEDTGFCVFKELFINHENGVAIDAVNADNCLFLGTFISRVSGGVGGSAIGIELHGGNDHRCARNLTFQTVIPGQGGVTARGGAGVVRPTFGHNMQNYSTAAGAPLPVIENGASLLYNLIDGTIFDGVTKPGSPIQFGGSVGINTPASYGLHQLGGQQRLQAIATPTAPTVALGGGTGTGTNRTYWIVAEDVNGNKTLPSPGTTFSGPATLTTTNWLKITWAPVPGAVKYYVLRSTSSAIADNTLLTLTGTWVSTSQILGAGANGANITQLSIINGGTGYTNGTFTDGVVSANGFNGSGGTFAYTIAGGIVTNLVVTNGGSLYAAPKISLGASAGAGSGFSGLANVAVGSQSGGLFLEADDTGQAATGTFAIPDRNYSADSTIEGIQTVRESVVTPWVSTDHELIRHYDAVTSAAATLALMAGIARTVTSAVAATNQKNARGEWLRISATASNADANLVPATFTETQLQAKPIFNTRVEIPTAKVNMRVFVGLGSAAFVLTTDTQSTIHSLYFRFSTAIPDTNWICCASNASGTTTIDSGVPVAVDTIYKLRIDCTDNVNIKFFINDLCVARMTATLPTVTQGLAPVHYLRSLSASGQKDLDVAYTGIYQ